MAKYNHPLYRDFRGGQNSSSSLDNLKYNEFRFGKNIDIDEDGGFTGRAGITRYNKQALSENPMRRLLEFRKEDGTVIKICGYDSALYTWDGDKLSGDFEIDLGKLDFEIYGNKVYFVDGNGYYVYDGETFEEVTASDGENNDLTPIKRCTIIMQRGQRLFFSGDKEHPNSLYFTEVGDPSYVKTDNVINAITDDDDHITALFEYQGALVVWKRKAIFAWFGYDPYSDVEFKRIPAHMGTVSKRTLCLANNILLFAGDDNVYALVGLYPELLSTVRLGDNVKDMYKKLVRKDEMFAVFSDGKYRLFCADDGEAGNNLVLVFFANLWNQEEQIQPWTHYRGWLVNDAMCDWDGDMYLASADTGIIYKFGENYSDDGASGNVVSVAGDVVVLGEGVEDISGYYDGRGITFYKYDAENRKLIRFDYVIDTFTVTEEDEEKVYAVKLLDAADDSIDSEFMYSISPIEIEVRFRPFGFEDVFGPEYALWIKKVKMGYVAVKQYGEETSYGFITHKTDYIDGTTVLFFDESLVWDEGHWDDAFWDWVDYVVKPFKIGEKGLRTELTIRNDIANQRLTVYGVGFKVRPHKPKKR